MDEKFDTIGIIGAGTMGQGIAQIIATAGYRVILYDINEDNIKNGLSKISENLDTGIMKGKITDETKQRTLQSIESTSSIKNVSGQIIIEAIVEDLKIKTELFLKLEEVNHKDTIFATNTSSIPITSIAEKMKRPGQLAGLHFFNPAHIMKLVEVISGKDSTPQVVKTLTDFSKRIGKTPVQVSDTPGFIVNRVARHFYVESLKILEDQVTDYKTIDVLLENFGFKMGPFRLMDLIGVDTNFAVTKLIYQSFNNDPKFKPSKIQQQKVEAGYHGRKTGRGFYEYN